MALAQAQRPQQMYAAQQQGRGGPSGLADVLEVLLDKGLVIDAFVRVSLVGIELLTVDARVVVASVDTYLRFAEAVNRLDLLKVDNSHNLGDLVGSPKKASRDEDGAEALDTTEHEPEERGRDDDSKPEEDEPSRQDENEDEDEDKGLIGRLRERGQVF